MKSIELEFYPIEDFCLIPDYEEDWYFNTDKDFLLRDSLDEALISLTYKQRRVLEMKYGLICEPMTLSKIGEILGGISGGRVRQIQLRALHKLRHYSRRFKITPIEHYQTMEGYLKEVKKFAIYCLNNQD